MLVFRRLEGLYLIKQCVCTDYFYSCSCIGHRMCKTWGLATSDLFPHKACRAIIGKGKANFSSYWPSVNPDQRQYTFAVIITSINTAERSLGFQSKLTDAEMFLSSFVTLTLTSVNTGTVLYDTHTHNGEIILEDTAGGYSF